MTLFEKFVAGGSAGTAVLTGLQFLREGKKMLDAKQKKHAVIVMACGALVSTIGVCHFINMVRQEAN